MTFDGVPAPGSPSPIVVQGCADFGSTLSIRLASVPSSTTGTVSIPVASYDCKLKGFTEVTVTDADGQCSYDAIQEYKDGRLSVLVSFASTCHEGGTSAIALLPGIGAILFSLLISSQIRC